MQTIKQAILAGLIADVLLGMPQATARRGIEAVSATKRYASRKTRGTARCNHRHREKVNATKWAELRAKLSSGYTIQQHDALVRRFGAVRTRVVEREILAGRLTFADAINTAPNIHQSPTNEGTQRCSEDGITQHRCFASPNP